VLRMSAAGAESLWDEILPAEVKALPDDLAALDKLLTDPGLLAPIRVRWERLLAEAGCQSGRGRPTIPMEMYVRLMIVKHRSGWGYETLMREVSDSLHLRRFCRLGLTEPVPDESTVRKLTRRLGAEVVHEITREVIQKARREKRFRPRAARIDSTVVEADVRYPTDAGLAADGVRALAREGRKLAAKVKEKRTAVRDRSRSMGRNLRALTRSIRRRCGEAKAEVLTLTAETGKLLERSIREARTLAATARRRACGRGARAKLRAANQLEELADRCEKITEQIHKRVNGEKITDRLVSLWDPDARPIRKGKLSRPTEFGYVDQLCEITPNTKPGARGFILPPKSQIGNPGREHAASRHRRRAAESRDRAQGDHGRRRVHDDRDQPSARGSHRHRPDRRPPRARVPTHPPPPTALPDRHRRPHQPPQTRLRPGPITPQRQRRPPDLGRLGDPHLQPRHLHHPRMTPKPRNRSGNARERTRAKRRPERNREPTAQRRGTFLTPERLQAFIRGK
jgi:IS5 family transposase